jgi:hypothetical protein
MLAKTIPITRLAVHFDRDRAEPPPGSDVGCCSPSPVISQSLGEGALERALKASPDGASEQVLLLPQSST